MSLECPVCGTPWDPVALRQLIQEKQAGLREMIAARDAIKARLAPLIGLAESAQTAVTQIARYGPMLVPPVEVRALLAYRATLEQYGRSLRAFVPLQGTVDALHGLGVVPDQVTQVVVALERGVAALPEPTEQDAARLYVALAQELLEAGRRLSAQGKRAEERAKLLAFMCKRFADASTKVLTGLYQQVEGEFSELYRYINREDEKAFSAKLIPVGAGLEFDVDFYGRGFFPPGAYHSEGHQDGMGVCLYLALMKHLLGDGFTFAVLDDVLMSVDASHRREVCGLLKERFHDTQFVLTTHDQVWLRHMRTVGLVGPKSCVHFRSWDVDNGPVDWDDLDVWAEVDEQLNRNDVTTASLKLRNYLEYLASELCHQLKARVEFRADAQYTLGDMLPQAARKLKDLLRDGRLAAESWGRESEAAELKKRESDPSSTAPEAQLAPRAESQGCPNLLPLHFGSPAGM